MLHLSFFLNYLNFSLAVLFNRTYASANNTAENEITEQIIEVDKYFSGTATSLSRCCVLYFIFVYHRPLL